MMHTYTLPAPGEAKWDRRTASASELEDSLGNVATKQKEIRITYKFLVWETEKPKTEIETTES